MVGWKSETQSGRNVRTRMRLYKVTLKLSSPYATDWQADTIWGQLCWALRFAYGEDELTDFITRYRDGEPPLLVSNGFPGDLLPRPILPEKPVKERSDFAIVKKQKKVRWLTPDEFMKTLNSEESALSEKDGETESVTLKNQINRLIGTTGGREADETTGRLFSFEQSHLDAVSIYLKVATDFVETSKELFQNLSRSGYGKRKTVGYGQFSVQSFDEFAGFKSPQDADGFISLSNFVPAADDPTSGYWEILVKYGKLGEEYAITGNPHKKPLVMFKAGSCFYDSPCQEYYGRLVRGLSSQYPGVVQYGYALPVPLKLSGRQVLVSAIA
jgi:CRISPR-associated protein Csm4